MTAPEIWEAVYKKPKEVISRSVAGETILVPISGKLADMQKIFALNAVAEYIWKQLDGEKNLGEIRTQMLQRFDVEENQLDRDIREFISELIKENLIVTTA